MQAIADVYAAAAWYSAHQASEHISSIGPTAMQFDQTEISSLIWSKQTDLFASTDIYSSGISYLLALNKSS